MMSEVTEAERVMWGPSIIGFGSYHYRYASGHEGDAARVGFSWRTSAISLYGLVEALGAAELLDILGFTGAELAACTCRVLQRSTLLFCANWCNEAGTSTDKRQ